MPHPTLVVPPHCPQAFTTELARAVDELLNLVPQLELAVPCTRTTITLNERSDCNWIVGWLYGLFRDDKRTPAVRTMLAHLVCCLVWETSLGDGGGAALGFEEVSVYAAESIDRGAEPRPFASWPNPFDCPVSFDYQLGELLKLLNTELNACLGGGKEDAAAAMRTIIELVRQFEENLSLARFNRQQES